MRGRDLGIKYIRHLLFPLLCIFQTYIYHRPLSYSPTNQTLPTNMKFLAFLVTLAATGALAKSDGVRLTYVIFGKIVS